MPVAKKAAGNPAEATACQTAAMRHPLARTPCQRAAFLEDNASADLRTGRAPKKSFFAPPSQRGGTGMW